MLFRLGTVAFLEGHIAFRDLGIAKMNTIIWILILTATGSFSSTTFSERRCPRQQITRCVVAITRDGQWWLLQILASNRRWHSQIIYLLTCSAQITLPVHYNSGYLYQCIAFPSPPASQYCHIFKGLIMDRCVLLTSTPERVVSPRRAITGAQPEWSPRGETTHEGVDVNNTHLSMINPDYNMMLAISVTIYQYSGY